MSIESVLGFDLETTGLDLLKDGILEVGCAVVQPDFTVGDTFRVLVCQPEEVLARMCPEVLAQHTRSGLLEECADHGVLLHVADETAAAWVKSRYSKKPRLLGFSIWYDRAMVRLHMPLLEKEISHRIVDVSSLNGAVTCFGKPHRVTDDILEAVASCATHIERLK